MGTAKKYESKRGRDIERTRRELLDAGRSLLFERGVSVELRNVPVTDVAARAGRSSGAVYHLWARQEQYHRDLALDVVVEEEWADSSAVAELLDTLLASSTPWRQTVAVAADHYLATIVGSRPFYVLLHMSAAAIDDPGLQEALRRGYELLHQEFISLCQALLDHYGLTVRPGIDLDMITVTVTALTEGFALRCRLDPARGNLRVTLDDEDRSVYVASIIAMLERWLIEPS